MVYNTIDTKNITGLDGIFVYVANEVPIFVPAFLLSTWLIVSLLIYFGTRKFSGQADFFSAAASAGFLTCVLGTVMTFTPGIINLYSLSTTIAIAIFSFIFLWVKRNRD